MATALQPRTHGDTVEDALIALDRDFTAIYGPDMTVWPKGVRGELLEMQRARRMVDREARPVHPRKASAGRRRRHLRQLPWRLQQIAPGAVTILVTPIWMDGSGESVRHYLARALDSAGRIITFAPGGSARQKNTWCSSALYPRLTA